MDGVCVYVCVWVAGGEVKLTLRDRGCLAVAEQGQTSLGYMFVH